MLEDAGLILKSSSPFGLSVDGVLKNISEWDAFVLNGFWKKVSFLIKKIKAGEK